MKALIVFAACAAAFAQDAVAVKQKLDAAQAKAAENFVFISGQMFNSNPVKGQPYSAEAVNETTQTLADGNKIVNRSSSTIYRDSDGRERREESITKLGLLNASDAAAKVVFISDPVAKVSYTLHSKEKTAERMPAVMSAAGEKFGYSVQTFAAGRTIETRDVGPGPGPLEARLLLDERSTKSDGRNAKVEQLGTQVIEGIAAEGTRTTTTIPVGQIGNERDINIVSERWYSQELGVLVMSKRSDPRTGEMVYRLTNVNRSEPPHSLFEVPADYTVFDAGSPKTRIRREEQ